VQRIDLIAAQTPLPVPMQALAAIRYRGLEFAADVRCDGIRKRKGADMCIEDAYA
jgi:hypothetical protein